jgi:hypothetical protein
MINEDELLQETLNNVRGAIYKVTHGLIYDNRGYLTKEGYQALETLEGLDLFWLGDPLIKLVSKKEEK